MAEFKYRMQNILNLKYKLEEQQKVSLASARAKLTMEEEALSHLFRRKEEYEEALRKASSKVIKIDILKILRENIVVIEYYIEEQKKKVKRAKKLVIKEEEKMIEAMKERKIQEKLREKMFENFLKEVSHEEGLQTDELVSYRFSIKHSFDKGGDSNGGI